MFSVWFLITWLYVNNFAKFFEKTGNTRLRGLPLFEPQCQGVSCKIPNQWKSIPAVKKYGDFQYIHNLNTVLLVR